MRSSVVGVAASAVGRSGAAVKRDKASSSPLLSALSSPAFPHSASYKVKEGDGERESGAGNDGDDSFPFVCMYVSAASDGRTEWMER